MKQEQIMNNKKTVLVLAPHTDDGELGCGGTIARLIDEGKEVYYAAFSSCRRSLPAGLAPDTLINELKAATTILGIPETNLVVFDYDVRYFPTNRQEILEDMVKLQRKLNPDLILLPGSNDLHQDHQTIHNEGLRAFKSSTILGYELPWNNLVFQTSCFIKLTSVHLDKKMNALLEYKSQLKRNYLNKEFIYGLATTRGVQIGAQFAEAFQVMKYID